MNRLKEVVNNLVVGRLDEWCNVAVDKRLVGIRLTGIIFVILFYAYEAAKWFNQDIVELNYYVMATSQVRTEFKRKDHLIQNLTNAVNQYATHERDIFRHVSDVRLELQTIEMTGNPPSQFQKAKIERTFIELAAHVDQYPDLKAEKCFHDLMDALEKTEDRIAARLDEYIERALDYNICNQGFWCNYWTYPVAGFVPLPSYLEYYHTDSEYGSVVPPISKNGAL